MLIPNKPGNPDFHGLAMTMPYDVSDSHDSDTIDITITHPPLCRRTCGHARRHRP